MAYLDKTGLERLWQHIISKLGSKAEKSDLISHTGNTLNPHGVTAAQIGADTVGSANTALANAKSYTDSKVNEFVGTSSVSTQISNAIGEIDYPVDSVNGKIGDVVLTESDVGVAAISEDKITEIIGTENVMLSTSFIEGTGIPVISMSGDITNMDKDNAVTLTYKYGNMTGTCTCKWQGSSSLYYPKKNYTIKFDNDFEAKEGWGAHKKYVLKANWVDSSGLRNLLGAIFWGRIAKNRATAPERLKNLPNAGAIDGFPVWVVLNGQNMGLYTFTIPKDAWLFGMTEEDTQAGFICFENYKFDAPALGDESDIEIEYAVDEAALLTSFNRVYIALNNVQSADDLSALEEVLDVDSVVDYILFSSMVAHHDGIVKNAIMATYDGVKWFMSAYDMDSIFGNMWDGASYVHPLSDPLINTMHTCRGGNAHKLFEVIFTYYKDKLNTQVWEDLYGSTAYAMNLNRVYEIVYNTAVKIPQILIDEENRLWSSKPATATNNIEQIITFHTLRLNEFTNSDGAYNVYKQIWGNDSENT